MANTKIEWATRVWNPLTGCEKISQGCKNCYAETMSGRLQLMRKPKYANGFALTLHPETLNEPKKWKKGSVIFVNSMSDLFNKDVPLTYIQQVFKVMAACSRHVFQVLTKRAERLEQISKDLQWTPNIWMGVSVENQDNVYRIEHLKNTAAGIKFLSLEPLLEPLPDLPLNGIDWVIVGGESGRKARPMKKEWVLDIKEQCNKVNVPFFFKQWGGKNKKAAGREIDGQTYDAMPDNCIS